MLFLKSQLSPFAFFSHGRSHSRGLLLPVRDNLDFQLRSIKVDSQGRYVFLEVSIQESPYFLLNKKKNMFPLHCFLHIFSTSWVLKLITSFSIWYKC